ncbi:D-alanyl-D-alanine carboxypeptidase family protein [Streptomyces sp. SYSU K217416]
MSAPKKMTASAVTVLSALLLPALVAGPALADHKPDTEQRSRPKPPVVMSSVGGAQLGQPGTQVNLGRGAPVLPRELSGRSWIVADAESGDVLAAHNAHWRLPPASTMKMLFADTLLPRMPKTDTHLVTEDELADVGEGSSLVGIKEDHSYTVHDLWLGVFLRSGNDAVHVLSAMNGGVDKTVEDMQRHAEELQALDTVVVSPDGYDEPGQVSSAYDLTLIARSGLQKKDFREYCSTASATFPGEQKEGKRRETFEIQNTNRLLTGAYGRGPYKGIAGVKNGNTTNAGSTFTGVAQRGDRVLLVTVMNPDAEGLNAVYDETAALFDWGFAAAGKVRPVGELVGPKTAEAAGASKGAPPSKPDHGKKTEGPAQAAVSAKDRSGGSGIGVALSITGGMVALLVAAVFLVNRRWPLRLPRR